MIEPTKQNRVTHSAAPVDRDDRSCSHAPSHLANRKGRHPAAFSTKVKAKFTRFTSISGGRLPFAIADTTLSPAKASFLTAVIEINCPEMTRNRRDVT